METSTPTARALSTRRAIWRNPLFVCVAVFSFLHFDSLLSGRFLEQFQLAESTAEFAAAASAADLNRKTSLAVIRRRETVLKETTIKQDELLKELQQKQKELKAQEEALAKSAQKEDALKHKIGKQHKRRMKQLTQKETELKEREEELKQKENQVMAQPSYTEPQDKHQAQEYVSACVQVMDANHELIEWLAFHYHTLPLRRLIVLNDPHSLTSPEPILRRWRGLIDITLWNITHVYKNGEQQKAGHIHLQRDFHGSCMKTLYDEGHRWLALFDPDEYITINERVYDETDDMYGLNLTYGSIEVPPPKEAGSTLKFLTRTVAHVHKYGTQDNVLLRPFETPCVQFHRKQYGTFEDNQSPDGDPPFPFHKNRGVAPSDLSTWRWRYWGKKYRTKGGFETMMGKAVIDLDRLRKDDIIKSPNVHRPIEDKHICREDVAWAGIDRMPLVANHYAASLEQAVFRSADSRGKDGNGTAYRIERYYRELEFRDVHEPHGHILEWLLGFQESVGTKKALRLLQDAGDTRAANTGAYLHISQEAN